MNILALGCVAAEAALLQQGSLCTFSTQYMRRNTTRLDKDLDGVRKDSFTICKTALFSQIAKSWAIYA
jgi:hypothetical protein